MDGCVKCAQFPLNQTQDLGSEEDGDVSRPEAIGSPAGGHLAIIKHSGQKLVVKPFNYYYSN